MKLWSLSSNTLENVILMWQSCSNNRVCMCGGSAPLRAGCRGWLCVQMSRVSEPPLHNMAYIYTAVHYGNWVLYSCRSKCMCANHYKWCRAQDEQNWQVSVIDSRTDLHIVGDTRCSWMKIPVACSTPQYMCQCRGLYIHGSSLQQLSILLCVNCNTRNTSLLMSFLMVVINTTILYCAKNGP